jgi:6-phosphogluconate dehydrogenase
MSKSFQMAKRDKIFYVRLSEREDSILKAYAKHVEMSASEVVRDFIKSLEQPKVGVQIAIQTPKKGKK